MYAWSGLKGFFKRDDLTVVNLECPVSRLGSQVQTGAYHFRADPNALAPMRAAGVEVASMAMMVSGRLGRNAATRSPGLMPCARSA